MSRDGQSAQPQAPIEDRGKNAFVWILLVAIALASLWIRAAIPVVAIAAPHDDFLFVSQAVSILEGTWLGTYNNLTHAKGAAYPVFIAANHWIGWPLKQTEQIVYLLAAMYLAKVLGKLFGSRTIVVAIFAFLAFNPALWSPVVGGRVVREGLYTSEVLLMFALTVRCYVYRYGNAVTEELSKNKYRLLALGLVVGVFWLTREEGVWIVPALFIMWAYGLLIRRGQFKSNGGTMVLYLITPFILASLPVFAVNSLNYLSYGVYRNNDFRSSEFVQAYGALSRIRHTNWQRYVVFPRDARDQAYSISPAARELRPYLEGGLGNTWRSIGCQQTRTAPCPEILSGWFMWALRDAVQAAGYYETATKATEYYRRLASEINQACSTAVIDCLEERNTLVPPWRPQFFGDTLLASWRIAGTLAKLHGLPIAKEGSIGSAEQMLLFERITAERIDIGKVCPVSGCPGGPVVSEPDSRLPYRLARALAEVERAIMRFGLPFSLLVLLIWVTKAAGRRQMDGTLVVALALAAAISSRVVLLGFLEATSIPSDNMLYLSPLVPLALTMIVVVTWGVVSRQSG